MARTKIVATIGPASNSVSKIRKMIKNGADVFRVNFSHGTKVTSAEMINNIRKAAGSVPVAILGDLCGPKIRCGIVENEPVQLKKGKKIILTTENIKGSSNMARMSNHTTPGSMVRLSTPTPTARSTQPRWWRSIVSMVPMMTLIHASGHSSECRADRPTTR